MKKIFLKEIAILFIIIVMLQQLVLSQDIDSTKKTAIPLITGSIDAYYRRFTLRKEYISDKDDYLELKSVYAPTLSANFEIDNLTIIPEFRQDKAGNEVFYKSQTESPKSTGSFIVAATYHF